MAETTFGRRSVNDGKLVSRLRNGRTVSMRTAERVEAFIADNPVDGPPRATARADAAAPTHLPDLPPEENFRFFDNRPEVPHVRQHLLGEVGSGGAGAIWSWPRSIRARRQSACSMRASATGRS